MGQSNATMKQGYCSVPQDVMASYGMTDAEYEAKARAVVARIRAMPNGYASVEDRAAAIDAVLKGTYVVALLCPCVLVCVRVFYVARVAPSVWVSPPVVQRGRGHARACPRRSRSMGQGPCRDGSPFQEQGGLAHISTDRFATVFFLPVRAANNADHGLRALACRRTRTVFAPRPDRMRGLLFPCKKIPTNKKRPFPSCGTLGTVRVVVATKG